MTLKRGHDIHFPLIAEDGKTTYGARNITPNREKDSRSYPIGEQGTTVPTLQYGGAMTLNPKERFLKTIKRNNIECVSTFKPD